MSTTGIKESALSLQYVNRLRFWMATLGMWPKEALGEPVSMLDRFLTKLVFFICAISSFGVINFIYQFAPEMSFELMIRCFVSWFLGWLTTCRATYVNLKHYGKIIARFFFQFHLINFKHRGGFYAKMHETVNQWSSYFCMWSLTLMVTAPILYNVSPIYPNYKNGAYSGNTKENATIEFSIYFVYPGFNPYDYFLTSTLLTFGISYVCSIVICSMDSLLSIMVFQIIGHVLILSNDLKEFPKPKKQNTVTSCNNKSKPEMVVSEMFDEEENEIVHKILIECIEHHKFIVSFTKDLSDFFGLMLGLNYLMHLMSGCLLLLQCTRGDAGQIISFVPLTLNIFGELIQISVIFEIVATVSEKLKDSVYETPWECMNTKNRRTICILLHRVQTPIRVMVLQAIPVGVTTMAAILKTTFSYFAFLRSIEQ